MQRKPSPPRRQPKQGRSKMLVEAIIEACQQILVTEGADQLTTNRIAEVAGVTIGSLYQYFPNKEAILATLFSEKIVAESGQIARQSSDHVSAKVDVSLGATIAELIRVKSALHLRYLELHGDFYREYYDFLDFHSLVDAHVVDVYRQPSWEEWLPELLQKYRCDIQVEDLEQAAFISARIIDRLLEAALEDNPVWLSDTAYLHNIEKAVMNFLCADDYTGGSEQ